MCPVLHVPEVVTKPMKENTRKSIVTCSLRYVNTVDCADKYTYCFILNVIEFKLCGYFCFHNICNILILLIM